MPIRDKNAIKAAVRSRVGEAATNIVDDIRHLEDAATRLRQLGLDDMARDCEKEAANQERYLRTRLANAIADNAD